MDFENSIEFAQKMDSSDELAGFRKQFLFPQHNNQNVLYFTGNSLGLQPVEAKNALLQELDDWEKFGVEGHFEAKNPWFSYHEMFKDGLSELTGAKPFEVTPMNGLTTNLHLLMVSFYRPKGKRYKIICEAKAFPSDQYALESQVKFHGYDYDDAVIEVAPRAGEHTIREEDIYEAIKSNSEEVALVMIGGVNYYTGQRFDMKEITRIGHEAGAVVGFDLAHAIGNIELELHDWGVDFAAWCSYKYLNSGPGSIAGIFVHERHSNLPEIPRFAGWWGNDPANRFKMEKGFYPGKGADGWQLSNAPVLSMAVHKVSLDIFKEAGISRLFEKRDVLTAYMDYVIKEVGRSQNTISFEIITPGEKEKRGSQLSILLHGAGKKLFDQLTADGVITDWREPNVIRLAPVPLYNSFTDVFNFGQLLKKALNG